MMTRQPSSGSSATTVPVNPMPEPFWMVLCTTGQPPKVKHPSFDAAQTEARRLARSNPGQIFVVLEAVEAVLKREFDVIRYRRPAPRTYTEDDDISF